MVLTTECMDPLGEPPTYRISYAWGVEGLWDIYFAEVCLGTQGKQTDCREVDFIALG